MYSDKTDIFYVFSTFCLLTTAFGAARIAADDGVPTAQSTKFLPYTPESEVYSYPKSPYEDCCRRQQESQNQWSNDGPSGQSMQSFQGPWQQQQPQPYPYQMPSNEYINPPSPSFSAYGGAESPFSNPGLSYRGYGAISPSGMGAGASFAYGGGMPMQQSEVYPAQPQGQAQYYQSPVISSPEYYPSYLDNNFAGGPYTRKTVYFGERVPSSQFIWKGAPMLSDPTSDTSSKVLEGK